MKILIACEESQRVCAAFRELGQEAYSCDIQECSGGHPEWHILGDVLSILNGNTKFITQDSTLHEISGKWDLIIAHPPCTYISNAGARHLYKGGVLQEERYKKGIKAKEFFMKIYNADCKKICVENPIPIRIFELPKYTQIIQPYEFGHPFQKRTCLWLKGLPKLKPTHIIPKEDTQSTRIAGNWFNLGGIKRAINRAKTFEGVARAMAEQWTKRGVKI